jgi:7,8-dihydropterin-6-yl-methyl-4-(beta-D-ribofuranosyl)aminobenzene 5'-phosphate synthase
MAEVRITILVENTARGCELLGEHGLSFLIELGDRKILFDTGQSNAIIHNAEKLNVDLKKTDAILLSHGHYDHTGGLGDVLELARQVKVYAHPATFDPKFARNSDGSARYIGMSSKTQQMVREQSELVLVEAPTEICDGLFLTGPVPQVTDFEDTGGPFFKDETCRQPDDLIDDQAAFLETPAGTVVILGCAHSGVINTLRYIQTLTNSRNIHTVIGGMHLISASEDRMNKTIAELLKFDIMRLYPCHCTGFAGIARLWSEFPGRCLSASVGTTIKLETE